MLGRALPTIGRECGCEVNILRAAVIKSKMDYFAVPPDDQWRTGLLNELISNKLSILGFSQDDTRAMVTFLCQS